MEKQGIVEMYEETYKLMQMLRDYAGAVAKLNDAVSSTLSSSASPNSFEEEVAQKLIAARRLSVRAAWRGMRSLLGRSPTAIPPLMHSQPSARPKFPHLPTVEEMTKLPVAKPSAPSRTTSLAVLAQAIRALSQEAEVEQAKVRLVVGGFGGVMYSVGTSHRLLSCAYSHLFIPTFSIFNAFGACKPNTSETVGKTVSVRRFGEVDKANGADDEADEISAVEYIVIDGMHGVVWLQVPGALDACAQHEPVLIHTYTGASEEDVAALVTAAVLANLACNLTRIAQQKEEERRGKSAEKARTSLGLSEITLAMLFAAALLELADLFTAETATDDELMGFCKVAFDFIESAPFMRPFRLYYWPVSFTDKERDFAEYDSDSGESDAGDADFGRRFFSKYLHGIVRALHRLNPIHVVRSATTSEDCGTLGDEVSEDGVDQSEERKREGYPPILLHYKRIVRPSMWDETKKTAVRAIVIDPSGE